MNVSRVSILLLFASLNKGIIGFMVRNKYSSPITTTTTSSTGCRVVKRQPTQIGMISSIFGGGRDSKKLPKDAKEAVSKCRAAVQTALSNRVSRMDIEMPVGADFAVEKKGKGRRKRESGAPTMDTLDRSDRELARLFVDMFQPLGGDQISVLFRDEFLADQALRSWKGDSTASCRIFSLGKNRKQRSGKKKKRMGFAAAMAEELSEDSGPFRLPKGTEVALCVAPGSKELITIERICSEVGMDTLVILLNARVETLQFVTEESRQLFTSVFEPVFHLGAAPRINEDPSKYLIYRAYPDEWLMGCNPSEGSMQMTVSTDRKRPSQNEYEKTSVALDAGDKGRSEGIFGGISGWF